MFLNTRQTSNFQLLVDRLVQDFGPDHKVVHYSGGVLPQSTSAMVVYTIQNLRNEQLAERIHNNSTLYIPPRDIAPIHPDMAASMELPDMMGLLSTSFQWAGPRFIETADYGPVERTFVDQLEQHVIPEGQKFLCASIAMRKFMINLATNPDSLKEYKANPSAVVARVPGLTDLERSALVIASDALIFAVMFGADIVAFDAAAAQGTTTVGNCSQCTSAS